MRETVMTPPCYTCGRPSFIEVDSAKYAAWRGGMLIQQVWPEWTPEERELMMTGWHPECFKRAMGEEES